MTYISSDDGIIIGTSECNRVSYRSIDQGPVIDGRQTWRRRYVGADGIPQEDNRVDTAIWNIACNVIGDVYNEHQRQENASRECLLRDQDDQQTCLQNGADDRQLLSPASVMR